MGMWAQFRNSFRDKLVSVFGYDKKEARQITAAAKQKYKKDRMWIRQPNSIPGR